MRLCIFEVHAETLEPLSLTRPVFALRCGIDTLAAKLTRYFGQPIDDVLIRPWLEDVFRIEHPGVGVTDRVGSRPAPMILANGRWLPPSEPGSVGDFPCVGRTNGGVAYVVPPVGETDGITHDNLPELLDRWRLSLPSIDVGGRLIVHPWDLVDANADEIARDFAWLDPQRGTQNHPAAVIGPRGSLWIARSANIEPMVVIDTTRGPVVIHEEANISAFTRLEGPCSIGARTQVFAAKIRAGTTLGPECRVGGEVEASIMHGHGNKYHDGFLGHSYVGSWVNLGAGTHNSDLRNDYGEITITMRGLPVPTGCSKVGCFLGDHTKTGLGTLLNTGTNVGAFCNLLPAGRFAPKYVPSFCSWWNGSLREAFSLEQLLATAEIAMKRRGVTLSAAHQSLYARLLAETADDRRRALRESEQRALRRSA